MTTEFSPSPNEHPNHVSTGSGKVKLKTSNERSYLKSRRSQHRTEKRQTILNFLDKNLGGSSSSNIDHHRDHHLGSSKGSLDKTPGSPTQRRRNISNASTAKSSSLDSWSSGLNAASDHSNLDGSFSERDKQKHHHQQRSRWNPFVKKAAISEQPATTSSAATDSPIRDNNNSNSSGKSRSRRSANRQRLAEHLSQERRHQEVATPQQQQQQLNESYHTQESQQHQQILDRVLKSYPKHSCRNSEDHMMFATAELTTLQNKLHLPQATFKLLKIKLKDRLDAQEADEYLRKQHEEQHIGGRTPQLSPKSQKSRRSKGPQVKRIVKTTSSSIAATDNNDNRDHQHHHHHRRLTSPSKSKSAPSSSAYKIRKNDELYGIDNNESSNIGTIQEEQGHCQQQNEQFYGEEALKDGSYSNSRRRNNSTSNSRSSAEDNSTTTPDSNRSLAVSTKSLVVPKQRPPSIHSLKVKPNDKDDTSRTTLEDDEDDDDPAAAAVASLLKYVEDKFMEDGNGHRGTYTGPVDQQSGLPHGTAGKMEYNHSHNHKFDNYQGEWYKGLFTGSGTLLKTNGDVYHGQFMDGVYHGKGHYQYYHSSRHFSGRHVQGQRVEGTMTYKDGSIYKGQFYKGKRHGRGQYTFQDSSVYKGEFSEDKLHGIGQLTWPDGSKYIGEWSNGVRHGTGKEYKADGSLRFQGRWKDGNEVRD